MHSLPPAITSRQNKTVKQLRALASSSKDRHASQTTILDGIHLCQSYLQSGSSPVSCVVSQSGLTHPEIAQLIEKLPPDTEIVLLADDVFDNISPVKHAAGVAFVIGYETNTLDTALSDDAILLEKIQDPGNIGTILRSAAAAGITRVLLSPGCASVWSPQTLRAGMGAHFNLTIYENVDLDAVISHATIPTYATSLQASQSIYQLDLTQPSAWLFGNEGQGVSDELLAACSQTVIIPQSTHVESLNVAMSATVCLFEQVRQRQ